MPIDHAIWTVGSNPVPLAKNRMASESLLESMIVARPEILSSEWMLIGRQVPTDGGRLDLLAIAPDASLVLVELKKDRSPRELVAQALDYASWVAGLTPDRIAEIYRRFSNGGDLASAFEARFGDELDEDALNESHQIVVVASQLDAASERIIQYLSDRDIPINALFFQVFDHAGQPLISRVWLMDPTTTQVSASAGSTTGQREPWNGEFYASYGGDRSWDDATKFGFISAGGGFWYSKTLDLLSPGDRVWVKVPKRGFVGVARVLEGSQPIADMMVEDEGEPVPAVTVLRDGSLFLSRADDPETAEKAVRVEWLDSLPVAKAINEIGLFGNQNSVCRPRSAKWRSTVERLKTFFPNWDSAQSP